MKRTFKKTLCALSAAMCILGSAIPASADTIGFNVTTPSDPYSYTVKKADSEQRFYVTGTYFSNNNYVLRCTSSRVGESGGSKTAYISAGTNASSARYETYAPYGVKYEMHTASSLYGFHVLGRYTP